MCSGSKNVDHFRSYSSLERRGFGSKICETFWRRIALFFCTMETHHSNCHVEEKYKSVSLHSFWLVAKQQLWPVWSDILQVKMLGFRNFRIYIIFMLYSVYLIVSFELMDPFGGKFIFCHAPTMARFMTRTKQNNFLLRTPPHNCRSLQILAFWEIPILGGSSMISKTKNSEANLKRSAS